MPDSTTSKVSRRDFLQTSTALTALGAGSVTGLSSRPAEAARESRRRPNVLYIFSDQHRAAAMGCYGDAYARTPNLDALANQGTRLDAAMSCTPVCCPHRASLMTGQYGHHHGVMSNSCRLESPLPCVAETFRDAGHVTGYAGKWHISEEGLDPERSGLVPTTWAWIGPER